MQNINRIINDSNIKSKFNDIIDLIQNTSMLQQQKLCLSFIDNYGEAIKIECQYNDIVSDIIRKYLSLSCHFQKCEFLFNGKLIDQNYQKTIKEAGIDNNSTIYVNKIEVKAFKLKFMSLNFIPFFPEEKISDIIERYRNKSDDRNYMKKFYFNANY